MLCVVCVVVVLFVLCAVCVVVVVLLFCVVVVLLLCCCVVVLLCCFVVCCLCCCCVIVVLFCCCVLFCVVLLCCFVVLLFCCFVVLGVIVCCCFVLLCVVVCCCQPLKTQTLNLAWESGPALGGPTCSGFAVVVVVVVVVVAGLDFPGPPSAGPPLHWTPLCRTAQNFALFSLPPPFLFFSPSLVGLFVVGGVFENRDPQMCTFGLSGCRVKPRRLRVVRSTFLAKEEAHNLEFFPHPKFWPPLKDVLEFFGRLRRHSVHCLLPLCCVEQSRKQRKQNTEENQDEQK